MAESTKRQRMDKIRRPSLQDGVGRLTLFSPRDDNGKVASVAIQRPRPERRAAGITKLGPDGCFLNFDVTLSSSGTKYLKVRNTEANWVNREIPWQWM